MTSLPQPLLEARNLHICRGSYSILPSLSCQVNTGELVMLIGANGAGKSTLLAALAGDLTPAAGELMLAGRAFSRWGPKQLAQRRTLLRQHSHLSLDFTAEEVVQMGAMARHASQRETRDIAAHMMSLTGVAHLAHKAVPSLSGGEQARVHLARVLTQLWPSPAAGDEPRLLLLDEPCASLDPYYQHMVCKLVSEFVALPGCAAIMTMHDMNLASQYASRVIALHKGQKLADGPAQQVLDGALIRHCFAVEAGIWQQQGRSLLATLPL